MTQKPFEVTLDELKHLVSERALEGETMEVLNPSTGEVIAEVP